MIEYQLGHRDRAEALFGHALTLNPHFHMVYSDQARKMLAQLAASTSQIVSASKPGASLQ
jgi:hypothetical protein